MVALRTYFGRLTTLRVVLSPTSFLFATPQLSNRGWSSPLTLLLFGSFPISSAKIIHKYDITIVFM